MELLSRLNSVTLPTLEQKKIYELETETTYKITFAKLIKNNYGKSVLVHLNEKISTFLPKRYSVIVDDAEELVGFCFQITSVKDKTVTLHFTKNKQKTSKKSELKIKN